MEINMSKKGFTLTEIMVVVGILGVFVIIVFNLLGGVNRTSSISYWRNTTNKQLNEAFAILSLDIGRANYPSIITNKASYKNPVSVGSGEYKHGNPLEQNFLRVLKGENDKITLSDGVDEAIIMMWQINTPEVIVTGMERSSESTLCTVMLKKDYQGKNNVLTYKIQAPLSYETIPYNNYKRIINNTEYILMENVDFIKITATPKYTKNQIQAFNEIKTNPGNYISVDSKDYFHDWMNPYTLVFEVQIKQDRRVSSVLRSTKFIVTGSFTVDPVSVVVKQVGSIN
ncbi:MAG: prepilin-type N-terminal cleavage/methylation domain-containing protein [Candidatus Muirbacterium halophilum]|nr:prepilin-type N-terminal cleavage/methylation domain-containing protein [Candidatus Muirbacterium halophilum]MCK9474399.1 prepilin-type N-terminal cleavage/methylation domain-containing protein [Candidatus Muirbacterium halophilum]